MKYILSLVCILASLSVFSQECYVKSKAIFELPELPYELDALEPVISRQTMELHYGKHLKGYITNLNRLVLGTNFQNADLETIVKLSKGDIYNNAGQTYNHVLYFNSFTPGEATVPSPELLTLIEKKWGSFSNFKETFVKEANSVFGSGWVWLVKDHNGNLYIKKGSNAYNPITEGYIPLLGIDVWEHAYYLDYNNRRLDHLKEIWRIVDWEAVESRY